MAERVYVNAHRMVLLESSATAFVHRTHPDAHKALEIAGKEQNSAITEGFEDGQRLMESLNIF